MCHELYFIMYCTLYSVYWMLYCIMIICTVYSMCGNVILLMNVWDWSLADWAICLKNLRIPFTPFTWFSLPTASITLVSSSWSLCSSRDTCQHVNSKTYLIKSVSNKNWITGRSLRRQQTLFFCYNTSGYLGIVEIFKIIFSKSAILLIKIKQGLDLFQGPPCPSYCTTSCLCHAVIQMKQLTISRLLNIMPANDRIYKYTPQVNGNVLIL